MTDLEELQKAQEPSLLKEASPRKWEIECKNLPACTKSECPEESNCPIIDGTRDECECFICFDSPKKCLCQKCSVHDLMMGQCDWRKQCGYSNPNLTEVGQ